MTDPLYISLATDENVFFDMKAVDGKEVARYSSTTDDVFVRLSTDNNKKDASNNPLYNISTGVVIGSSNFDKTSSMVHDFYIGSLYGDSNIDRLITVRKTGTVFGLNVTEPKSYFDVRGNCFIGSGHSGSSSQFGGGFFMYQNGWLPLESSGIYYIDPANIQGYEMKNSAGSVLISASNKGVDLTDSSLNKMGIMQVFWTKPYLFQNTSTITVNVVSKHNPNIITFTAEASNNMIKVTVDTGCRITWTQQAAW